MRRPVSPSMSVCHPSTAEFLRRAKNAAATLCSSSALRGHRFAAVADLRGGMVKWPICDWVGFHELAARGPSECVAEGVEVEVDSPGASSISLRGANELDPIVAVTIAGGVGDRFDRHLVPEGEEVGAKPGLQFVSTGGTLLPLAIRIIVGLIAPDDVPACNGGSTSTGLRPERRRCSSSRANLRFLVFKLRQDRLPLIHGRSNSIPPFLRYMPSAAKPVF